MTKVIIKRIGKVTLRTPKVANFRNPMEARLKAEANDWNGTMTVSGKTLPLQLA